MVTALTTSTQVKKFYQGNVLGNYNDEINLLIEGISTGMALWLGRDLGEEDETTYYNGSGMNRLYPRRTPITSISELNIDSGRTFGTSTALVEDTDFIIDPEDSESIIFLGGVFPKNVKNIKLTSLAGYPTIPSDVQMAIAAWVASLLEQAGKLIVTSFTVINITTNFDVNKMMPKFVQLVMQNYKRNSFGTF